jgi:hypothetical protein
MQVKTSLPSSPHFSDKTGVQRFLLEDTLSLHVNVAFYATRQYAPRVAISHTIK